jgi:hypothetical protein
MLDWTHAGAGNQITNNIINGNGGPGYAADWDKALYLDTEVSWLTVSGNVCRTCGEQAYQIHGGDHVTVTNNIFDLSSAGTQLCLYQGNQFAGGDLGMTGNVFSHNIVYWSGSPTPSLCQVNLIPGDALPADSYNLYYSASGAFIPNGNLAYSDLIVDSNPVYANPEFANPSAGNYSMPGNSPAYTQIGFQPLATDQGPLPSGSSSPAPPSAPSGALNGSGNSATTTANLTTEGTTDWIHWGDTAVVRKSGVTAQISSYSEINSGAVFFYNNDPRFLTWTDGTPTSSATHADGIYVYGQQHGFSFTAPAGTSTHTLTVHVGGWYSGGTLTAHLSDGSASDFSDTTSSVNGQYDRNYTLVYNAASSGQSLTVTWEQTSGVGNVTLDAAALQ